MARPPFDPKELEPTGEFFPQGRGFPGAPPPPPEPKRNWPITPAENLLLLGQHKKPYWIPSSGMGGGDSVTFRPRVSPDNIANKSVWDGGPEIDFSDTGDLRVSSWFDMEWEFTDIGGASVRPGNPRIKDITKWEEYVSMPDLDILDWDECREQNIEYLGTGKFNTLLIYCGLWERLMNLMDVSEACIALIDDDLKPHTHRFLDAYCDFMIDYISRVKANCNIHGVTVTEDWAHQRGAFFSPDTGREMIVPYIKRITDWCHANGMIYEIHMCGDTRDMVPLFPEAGVDIWSAIQPQIYDQYEFPKKYKDQNIAFGIAAPVVTPDASDEEMREKAQAFVEEYKDCKIMLSYFNMDPNFPGYHPGLKDAIYEYSRKAFQDED